MKLFTALLVTPRLSPLEIAIKFITAACVIALFDFFRSPTLLAEDIRIGAWNIEWLGFPDKRGKPGKDVAQDPADLAGYIAQAKIDVLSLEEIGVDHDKAPWTSSHLQEILDELKSKHGQAWEYVLFAKAHYPQGTEDFVTRGQHIGLAWRSDKAKLVGSPYSVSVGASETYGIKFWERRANAVKLSFGEGKTDVVFVPVHLKSNRNDANPTDETFTQKQRQAETKTFADQLRVLKEHFKDEDIVLLGDTNILADEDETPRQLTDAGLVDLNHMDQGTTAAWGQGYSSAPFDRIFVPAHQPEFSKSVQWIHRTKNDTDEEIKDFKKRFSDHYLISCDIVLGNDDD